MLAPIVAALACALSAPSVRAGDGSAAMSPAPLVASSAATCAVARPWSPADAVCAVDDDGCDPFAADDAPASSAVDAEPMTPIAIDCVAPRVFALDGSALVSRLDGAASCGVVASDHGRTPTFARARARAHTHRVDAGSIGTMPEPLAVDSHLSLLAPARIALVLALIADAAPSPASTTPAAAPPRRIDRPPRS